MNRKRVSKVGSTYVPARVFGEDVVTRKILNVRPSGAVLHQTKSDHEMAVHLEGLKSTSTTTV